MICRRKWKAMPKVPAIVNEKAAMAGRELPVSDMVLAKINPSFGELPHPCGETQKRYGWCILAVRIKLR